MIVVDARRRSSIAALSGPETRATGASRLVTVRAVGAGTTNQAAKPAQHKHIMIMINGSASLPVVCCPDLAQCGRLGEIRGRIRCAPDRWMGHGRRSRSRRRDVSPAVSRATWITASNADASWACKAV